MNRFSTVFAALILVLAGGCQLPMMSQMSNAADKNSSAYVVPPSAPTGGISVTPGNAQAIITWTAVAGATSYNVYRSTTADTKGTRLNSSPVTATSYTDTTVTNAVTYYYEVTAVNAGGESAPSVQQSVIPQASVAGAPSAVSVSAGNAQVTLSWTAVSGAASYNVYYSTASGVTTTNGTKVSSTTNAETVTGLTNGTTYYFIVTAVSAAGESVASTHQSATPQVPVAGAPSGVSVSAGNAQITLSWTAVAGATSNNVYYSTASGLTTASSGSTRLTGVTSPYTLTGLTNGTTYYLIVTSVNVAGEIACVQVSAEPQVPPGVWGTSYWDQATWQ